MSNSIAPATRRIAVTKSDTEDLPFTTQELYFSSTGTAGNVRVLTTGDDMVTYPVTPGMKDIIAVRRVFATGTTFVGDIWASGQGTKSP